METGRALSPRGAADAPLVRFGNIALPYAPFPKTLPQDEAATIFSWVHNNLWDTDFPG
ncbi:hypothetical protein [Saccharopolyspora shandongensis]|uniref:hypothetical protein n=1 Tax=Saccharopolyspora shandongensis TaxID=418495 RepID=UPI0033FF74EC